MYRVFIAQCTSEVSSADCGVCMHSTTIVKHLLNQNNILALLTNPPEAFL